MNFIVFTIALLWGATLPAKNQVDIAAPITWVEAAGLISVTLSAEQKQAVSVLGEAKQYQRGRLQQ